MSMIIDGTNGLTFNNATTQNSGGKVLQVIQASTTTGVNTASTSPVDSNLTATITPLFATSKILISVNQSLGKENAATSSALLNLVRGSSTLTTIAAYLAYTGTTTPFYGTTCAYQYLDSPSTTSATTYKTQVYCNTASGNALAQPNNSPSTITLMEIAA